nr:reverse transcriptase domain-containing protein [Tanacetum cinerariifolium]
MKLTFVDTHNMIVISPNPMQFWSSVAVKKVNDVTRLQALVDKKRVIITEATIRDALHLDDAEGVKCLPNEEIFTELARMGYEKPLTKLAFYKAFFSCQWKFLIHIILQCMSAKRTSWNEFSSSMAFAVICLFTGMIVEQHVDEGAVEVNVEDVYTVGVATEGVVSVADDVVPTVVEEPSIPSSTPLTPPPSPIAQPQSSQHQPQPSQDVGISMDLLQNLLDTCTTLTRRFKHLEQDKVAQALEINKLKQRVKKLERKNKASKPQRLKKCMRTHSKSYPNNSNATISRRRNRRRVPNIVEPEIRTIEEFVPMADRTMEELLQAPTEGDVPNDAIKLMFFPYSLEGAARIWYKKEHPNSILTWDDLLNNFVNQFFPPLKTTHLKNEISRFTQRFEETFGEPWERFKEMLRARPHHGFSKEALKIIENKSKVRYSRVKSNVSRVNTNSKESSSKTDDRIDKLADQILNLVEIVNKQVITPATVKAVEKSCVICGGAHAYYDCIATNSNQSSVCAETVTTRSGLAYNGPLNPTNSSPEKIVERETEETTDKEQPNCQRSTAHIQSPVVPTPIPEPDVPQMEKLLTNKDKLFELAKVPLNGNFSAMLLKKLPKNLGDPGKFLLPCDFPRMDVCHALIDLGASINLMPLFVWKKLSLHELTPTRMTLELADRSITRPKGVAEDVFVKVGKFHFPTDFVVVDFEADPREYAQDVLDFKYNSKIGNPTLVSNPSLSKETKSEFYKEPIVKSSSLTIPMRIEDFYHDPEGDILYLEKLLNDDPSQLPPMELKQAEETKAKSLIEEPPELELKELPSHLEYDFLKETDKLPVIISKYLKDDEKEALLKF